MAKGFRRYFINGNPVNDPANFDEFSEAVDRNKTYKGLFIRVPNIKLRWFAEGKELLEKDYEKFGSTYRQTTLLIEQSTDLGITYNTEYEFNINYEDTAFDFEGEAEYIEVGVRQVDALQKFLSRDGNMIDVQSLEDLDEGVITPFTDETFTIDLDAQIISKLDELSWQGNTGPGSDSEADVQNKVDRTIYYNLPWDTKDKTQIGDTFIYPPEAGDYAPGEDEDFPVTNGDVFENVRLTDTVETAENVFISTSGEVRVDIDTDPASGNPIFPAPVFKMVFVAEFRTSEGDTTGTVFGTSLLTANVIGNTQFNVPLTAGQTLTGPFDQFDRFYVYLIVEGVTSISDVFDFTFNFNAESAVDFEFRTAYPNTDCEVVLIHDYIKRLFQSMTGLDEPIRSDFYGSTNSTYLSGGVSTAYSSDGDGALRGVTNGFQLRGFSLSSEPMIDSFSEFFKFLWGVDACAVGLEYDNDTPYFRIEPIEYFYDKTTLILDIPFNPKQVTLRVDASLTYSKIKFGDKNYKDEKFGILNAINAPREFSVFSESDVSKTYDFSIPQITNGTLIELTRRKPFADFEEEDTNYDDAIFVIVLRRTGATTFDRDKDQDFTSITGIDFSDTVYNLKLTPKRRLLKHLQVLGANLWGVIENPGDYGNPNIVFRDGKGNSSYTTQLTTEGSPLDEDANIPIDSTNITPLFTNEEIELEVPLDLTDRYTVLTVNQGFYQVESRGKITKFFLNLGDVKSQKNGRTTFTAYKLYE